MNHSRLKFEHLLYAIAFLLALAVRFAALDGSPLSDREAGLALQALELSKGLNITLAPHPLYLTLTSLLMFVFTASDWIARFWPALAGSLLVLLPLLFRGELPERGIAQRFYLGRYPAILLSFFLALDPGLAAVSRQAGSAMLALFFTFLALGLWRYRQIELAGIAAGLALLAGPGIWPGLIALAVTVFLVGMPLKGSPDSSVESSTEEEKPPSPWRRAVIFALAAIFFAGTLFFSIPGGLSAMAGSIPAYLSGWLPGNSGVEGASLRQVLVGLLLYEFFPLFFGIWGGVRGLLRKITLDRFFLVWWIISLALVLAYPAHQVADLVWSLIPLWALAARQITRLASIPSSDRLPAMAHAALNALIVGFFSVTVVSMVSVPPVNAWEFRVKLAGAAIMLVASTGLIGWGWSREVALRGFSWGIAAVLVVYSLAAAWNATGLSGRSSHELWSGQPMIKQANLISTTLTDLARQGPTISNGPDLAVEGVSTPAVRWLLKDVKRVTYSEVLTSDASPALVITADQPDLALAALYRGQSLVLSEAVAWDQLKPAEWFRWMVFRSLPEELLVENRVILWARSDFIPGGIHLGMNETLPGADMSPE